MGAKVKLEFSGFTKDGKIVVRNKQGFIESVLSVWPSSNLKITVQKLRKNRSNRQNAYLWGCVYPLILHRLRELGNDGLSMDLVHDFCKGKFMEGVKVILPGGEIDSHQARRTTTTLTTTEMAEYILFIQQWASDILDIYIPEPNEQGQLFE